MTARLGKQCEYPVHLTHSSDIHISMEDRELSSEEPNLQAYHWTTPSYPGTCKHLGTPPGW
jgi:hypothetical protein